MTTTRVSNSEIQTFKDCRRRWWLTYYRGLQSKKKDYTGPLALGTRLHKALELYYSTDTPLLEAHSSLVKEERQRMESELLDTTSLESEAELGRVMLEGYLQWVEEEGIDSELELVSTEQILTMPMLDGRVELQGKIDMRVKRKIDGVRMFRDFKSVGGSLADFAAISSMNEQILTYMVLEMSQENEDKRSEGGIFTLLKKVKRTPQARPPFYDQIEVRHNIFTIRSFISRLNGSITDLMNVRDELDRGADPSFVAYPRPTRDCKWKCKFFHLCTMFDDGSSAEQALSELFEESDPYSYYDSTEVKGSE